MRPSVRPAQRKARQGPSVQHPCLVRASGRLKHWIAFRPKRVVSDAEMSPAQAELHRHQRETAMLNASQPVPTELERFRQRAAILLAGWISLGLMALLMIPAARGFNEWVGWLPFWLLLAPFCSLLVLQRSRIARWLQARPARPALPRRRHAAQARRPARRSNGSEGERSSTAVARAFPGVRDKARCAKTREFGESNDRSFGAARRRHGRPEAAAVGRRFPLTLSAVRASLAALLPR